MAGALQEKKPEKHEPGAKKEKLLIPLPLSPNDPNFDSILSFSCEEPESPTKSEPSGNPENKEKLSLAASALSSSSAQVDLDPGMPESQDEAKPSPGSVSSPPLQLVLDRSFNSTVIFTSPPSTGSPPDVSFLPGDQKGSAEKTPTARSKTPESLSPREQKMQERSLGRRRAYSATEPIFWFGQQQDSLDQCHERFTIEMTLDFSRIKEEQKKRGFAMSRTTQREIQCGVILGEKAVNQTIQRTSIEDKALLSLCNEFTGQDPLLSERIFILLTHGIMGEGLYGDVTEITKQLQLTTQSLISSPPPPRKEKEAKEEGKKEEPVQPTIGYSVQHISNGLNTLRLSLEGKKLSAHYRHDVNLMPSAPGEFSIRDAEPMFDIAPPTEKNLTYCVWISADLSEEKSNLKFTCQVEADIDEIFKTIRGLKRKQIAYHNYCIQKEEKKKASTCNRILMLKKDAEVKSTKDIDKTVFLRATTISPLLNSRGDLTAYWLVPENSKWCARILMIEDQEHTDQNTLYLRLDKDNHTLEALWYNYETAQFESHQILRSSDVTSLLKLTLTLKAGINKGNPLFLDTILKCGYAKLEPHRVSDFNKVTELLKHSQVLIKGVDKEVNPSLFEQLASLCGYTPTPSFSQYYLEHQGDYLDELSKSFSSNMTQQLSGVKHDIKKIINRTKESLLEAFQEHDPTAKFLAPAPLPQRAKEPQSFMAVGGLR